MLSAVLSAVLLHIVIAVLPIQRDIPPASQSESEITGVEYFENLTEANRLYTNQDYAEAVSIYERLSRSDKQNGKLFERIFKCHTRLGNRIAARKAAEKMVQLGHGDGLPYSYYAIAQNYALEGERRKAIAWFEKALDARLKYRSRLQTNSAFKSLRDDPRFAELAGLLPNTTLSRDEGWRYDLEFFTNEVARLNADPEHRGHSKAFQNQVKSLVKKIPELSNESIALEVQKIAVTLGNGHSNIYPIPTKHVQFSMLPIQLYLFSDGLFVVGGKGDAVELVGQKVISIGSKDISTLMELIKPIVHRDNQMGVKWLGPQFLCIPEVLVYINAIKSAEEVEFKLQNSEGETKTVTLTPGPMRRPSRLGPANADQQPPLYLQKTSNNYWLQKLPQSETIYFQFNQVRNKPGGQSISAFAETLRTMIIETKPKNIIVDLRHNNGGVAYLAQPLIPPLVLFEMLDKENRLFVITGRSTFSAAQNFLNHLESVANPIIVGEPSSGRPNSVGAESEVMLPWSGLRMSIGFYYFQDSKPWDTRPWIPPQVPIKVASTDYFANRDAAMEAINRIIKKNNANHN